MAEILPRTVPEFFFQKDKEGKLIYAVPGWDVTSIAYDVALTLHKACHCLTRSTFAASQRAIPESNAGCS